MGGIGSDIYSWRSLLVYLKKWTMQQEDFILSGFREVKGDDLCMTAGVKNMIYVVGKKKATLPVVKQEALEKARLNAGKYLKK